ncbi:Cna B-type domain-containing protein [Peptostreptococcus sp. D1]|uniref:Cna B-type domain-containing protein n=1 Tax=Peptostreptococcus sp. D1 TaxID=72304 RepID=UPI0008EDAD6F|nr:Cna B-type domain-containing protein [Peptostreptococcus sp. D1]SFE71845.1 LPXTG-motif cell wall anchor domain-containing protein/Listeria/Bacterioides repeat-containing protein [Peptostreptococcus sp. D1]
MGNGELVVYDDSHKIKDMSNGDGTSLNSYNLATMTDTLFTISYTPFRYVGDDGKNEFGDQKIVVDIPIYGFKLTNPGNESVLFDNITLLDKDGKTIPLDSVTQKNYDKVVKIVYDIKDTILYSLGDSNILFNIAFSRKSLSVADCEKWLKEGKLETILNVAACEGKDNKPIKSKDNPSEYKWRMTPDNFDDTKTKVTGDRYLNASSNPKITNAGLTLFYDREPKQLAFDGNKDWYYYTQGTIHDNDTPLMKLKQIKLYVPKTTDTENNFILYKLQSRSGLYDSDLATQLSISEIKNDNNGKGNYYILTPKRAIYNNGSDFKWSDALKNGFSPVWQVADGVEDLGSEALYEAEPPEIIFETPNGIDGSKEVMITDSNQGVKIKTFKKEIVDNYEINNFLNGGYRLGKNASGFYTANAVSADANYKDVSFASLHNNWYVLKNASGGYTEYFPQNKTGATIETFEFPEEIQPRAWHAYVNTWAKGQFKIDKVVYTTEDGREYTEIINDDVYLYGSGDCHTQKVSFNTSGGRVTKVKVYWEHLNNEIFNAYTYSDYTANRRYLYSGESRFDYYITPEATGLLQVKYSAESIDSDANINDSFISESEKALKSPVNNISGKAYDDFFWMTVVKKPCTPIAAESTDERKKQKKILYPEQAENGTFFDTWMIFFNYGKDKKYSPTSENPKIIMNVDTLNLKGLDSQEEKNGFLTGKFKAMKALSGWKIIYKTADNLTNTESIEKVYNIGDIEDGTVIELGIDRKHEHLSSIALSYDGIFNIEPFVDTNTGRAVLFSNIEYELRNTSFKGKNLEIVKDTGSWYGPNYFVVNLTGKYYNDNCTDSNQIHTHSKGQVFGGRSWNSNASPQLYGTLTRTYIVTNKTNDNIIDNHGDSTNNTISQGGTATQKVTFKTKAYAYVMHSDMPKVGQMPYGIPEAAYVEITDKQFSADLDKCKFLGYNNASGNVKIEQITDADSKKWIKMSITDVGIQALNREIREITKNKEWSYYYGDNSKVLKFMEDPIVIALKSYRYTSITKLGENEHYPYGMVYYDMSSLENKLDGSKEEYYSYAKLEGDLYSLADNAATALGATKEKKLFGIKLSNVQVIVSKNAFIGSNIFPGKYDDIVYDSSESGFTTQKFYQNERADLRGDFFVQVPDGNGFKEYKTIIEIPKKGKFASYTSQNLKNDFDMYLTGEAIVSGDSRQAGKREFIYSIDGGNTFVSADNIDDWSKVTHVKIDLGELPKSSQVSIKLPLRTDAKNTIDEIEAYIGGNLEATDYTGYKISEYIKPAKYVYGSFTIAGSDVWWDKNENGKFDDGEDKASGIKLELYSPNHDIAINDRIIPANTLIDSATTNDKGEYELKSYMLDEGQWIKVIVPNDEVKLTVKAKASDMLKLKNSDFDRISYETSKLPELIEDKALDSIGCGLIILPKIKIENVKLHVGEESMEEAAKAIVTSDHPTEKPALKYIGLSSDIAEITDKGKVKAKATGKIQGEAAAANTLAGGEQAIPEDTVKVKYDIIIYGNVIYHKNHTDVTGEVPKDNTEYYPSAEADGIDADTDKVTVLDQGTMKRANYIFNGWNTQADGKGITYYKGDTFKIGSVDKDVELYAIWSLIWTPMRPPTRDIKVTKEWKDSSGNNLNEAPVEKIEVELYKDGVATGSKKELNKDNNWTVTFEKLKAYESIENPTIHKYTVKEIGEDGSAIQFNSKWFGVRYDGTMADGFTITNKEKTPWTPMEPSIRDIKVTKLWKDHSGNTIKAPTDKITVELYKDGNPTGKTLELNSSNNWSGVFKKLEVANGLGTDYYKYTVKEAGEDGNIIKFDDKQYKVVYGGSMKDGLTITNEKKAPQTPPSTPTTSPSTPITSSSMSTTHPNTSTRSDRPTASQNTEKPNVSNTSISKNLPKTGDEANLSIYAWIMLVSGISLLLLDYKRRKYAK